VVSPQNNWQTASLFVSQLIFALVVAIFETAIPEMTSGVVVAGVHLGSGGTQGGQIGGQVITPPEQSLLQLELVSPASQTPSLSQGQSAGQLALVSPLSQVPSLLQFTTDNVTFMVLVTEVALKTEAAKAAPRRDRVIMMPTLNLDML